ncbi:MAG: hypothetical protein CMK83_11400 [Pseudomonadales bacterium]|nr:hypothetical protein [Pseudomonadales bacterium]HBO92338.1 hypothetical protein [Gammaproteobacteria bacterium]HCB38803.1 hypothetical protein [Gammaproteobacteria bacterium]
MRWGSGIDCNTVCEIEIPGCVAFPTKPADEITLCVKLQNILRAIAVSDIYIAIRRYGGLCRRIGHGGGIFSNVIGVWQYPQQPSIKAGFDYAWIVGITDPQTLTVFVLSNRESMCTG